MNLRPKESLKWRRICGVQMPFHYRAQVQVAWTVAAANKAKNAGSCPAGLHAAPCFSPLLVGFFFFSRIFLSVFYLFSMRLYI